MAVLSRIEQRYGVPASIMLGIYGQETSYGAVTGTFDLLQSARHPGLRGRRRPLFEDEFVADVALDRSGHPRWRLKGELCRRHGLSAIHAFHRHPPRADGDGDGDRDNLGATRSTGSPRSAIIFKTQGWKPGMSLGHSRCASPRPSTAPRFRKLPPRGMPARARPPQPAD